MESYEKVKYGEDFISIEDDKGEIVYWSIDEWKENEKIIFSICRAVELSKENLLRETLKSKA